MISFLKLIILLTLLMKSAQGDQEGIVVGLFNDKSVLLKL